MHIDYNKKLNGLCYAEDVLDRKSLKVAKMIFNNRCEPLFYANCYLVWLRKNKMSSYNSLNLAARDLLHFHNYLLLISKSLQQINKKVFDGFLDYLKSICLKDEYGFRRIKFNYSIENSLVHNFPYNVISNNKNLKMIDNRLFGLNGNSISRIYNRVTLYLKYIINNFKLLSSLKVEDLPSKTNINRILKVNGINGISHTIERIDKDMLITDQEMESIHIRASKSKGYATFLFFLLRTTGMRIGEAIGLKILYVNKKAIKELSGDIIFNGEAWEIRIIPRSDDPNDSRVKSGVKRTIEISEADAQTFEILLERYLKWRNNKVKGKNIEWLFISNSGNKLTQNTAYKRFKSCLSAEHKERNQLTLHSYRHTFCTNELKKGTSLYFLYKYVGHKDPKTTLDMYIHLTGKLQKDIMNNYIVLYEK